MVIDTISYDYLYQQYSIYYKNVKQCKDRKLQGNPSRIALTWIFNILKNESQKNPLPKERVILEVNPIYA
jgi:hypothetical protein